MRELTPRSPRLETCLFVVVLLLQLTSIMLLVQPMRVGLCPDGTVRVPEDFARVAWAVGNASEGSTILIGPGNYSESQIVVSKSLTIVGRDADAVVLNGSGTANYMFHVMADNVAIRNLTLLNTNPDNFSYSPAVRVSSSANASVEDVKIRAVLYGVEVYGSNFTSVRRCWFSNCTFASVWLHFGSLNSTLSGNRFENNFAAIYVADASSKFTAVCHNDFVDNTQQVLDMSGSCILDNGYPSGGNYWSDHLAADAKSGPQQNETGSDGILDEMCPLGDRYPWAFPITSLTFFDGACEVRVSTNTTLASGGFNQSSKTLSLAVFADGDTCAFRVAVPKNMLYCDNIGDWVVKASENGGSPQTLERLAQDDDKYTYLYFVFNGTADAVVQIVGTVALPELNLMMLAVLLAFSAFSVVVLRKRLRKPPVQVRQNA